jgi:hypothetical protein
MAEARRAAGDESGQLYPLTTLNETAMILPALFYSLEGIRMGIVTGARMPN